MRRKKHRPLTATVIGYELYITAAFFAFVLFLSLIATLSHCMPSLEGGMMCMDDLEDLNPFEPLTKVDFTFLMALIWMIGGAVMFISYFICRRHEFDQRIKEREKTKFK